MDLAGRNSSLDRDRRDSTLIFYVKHHCRVKKSNFILFYFIFFFLAINIADDEVTFQDLIYLNFRLINESLLKRASKQSI